MPVVVNFCVIEVEQDVLRENVQYTMHIASANSILILHDAFSSTIKVSLTIQKTIDLKACAKI